MEDLHSSHRFRYVDPYMLFWFDYPIVQRDDTLFFDLGGKKWRVL